MSNLISCIVTEYLNMLNYINFWKPLQINILQPIIVSMGISNPYTRLNMEMIEHRDMYRK